MSDVPVAEVRETAVPDMPAPAPGISVAVAHARARRLHMQLAAAAALACLIVAGAWFFLRQTTAKPVEATPAAPQAMRVGPDTIQLTPTQMQEVKAGPAATMAFEQTREALGTIDFNQDRTVQVFAPYQGRISKVFVKAGDAVKEGQSLYTILIPDLAQAGSTLISTAATLAIANQTLKRAKALYEAEGISQRELQQNTAEQQGAEVGNRAARKTLALFGLSESEITRVERTHEVDTEMTVHSPITGLVTARSAAPGLLVQPGSTTAPVSVSDMSRLWMVANVPESELAAYRVGQQVAVTVPAYPKTVFSGQISYIGQSVDVGTHRLVVRAEVDDPQRRLRPQMLASFKITLAAPVAGIAVPPNALVRESDGSTSVWLTRENLRFMRRTVKTGMTGNGMVQVVEGLAPGDVIAQDKALYLSNLYLTVSR